MYSDSPGPPRPRKDKRGKLLSAKTLTNNSCVGGTKRDLINLDVCIEDTSRTSPDYFNVTKCDDKFTIGSNAISFQANARMFQPGSEIQIEVLDSQGNALKYEIKKNTNADGRTRTVCFTVCDDTPTGPSVLAITGIAMIDNNCGCPLPLECQDRINLRWSRKIYIDPSLINDEPIDWYEPPIVEVEERIVPWSHITVTGQEHTVTTAAPTLYHDTSPTGSDIGSAIYTYDGQSQYATVTLANADYTTFYESDGTTQLAGSNVKNQGTSFDPPSTQWVNGTINFHKFYSAAHTANGGAIGQVVIRLNYRDLFGDNNGSEIMGKTVILIDTAGTSHTFTVESNPEVTTDPNTLISTLTSDINSNSSFSAVYHVNYNGSKDYAIVIDQASIGTGGNTAVGGNLTALSEVDIEGINGSSQTGFTGGLGSPAATVAYSYGANQTQNIGRGVWPHEANHSTVDTPFTVPSSSNLLPAAMSTTIRQILDGQSFFVDPISQPPNNSVDSPFISRIGFNYGDGIGGGLPFVIKYLGSEGSVTTKDPDTNIAIDQSYASINVRNLKPCCSEITHINVYLRSHHKLGYGDNAGFELLNVIRLHPTNFMVDKNTTTYSPMEGNLGNGSTQFINFGKFINQLPLTAEDIKESYWEFDAPYTSEYKPSATLNSVQLLGGVKITNNSNQSSDNYIDSSEATYYTMKPAYSHSLAPGSSSFYSGSTYQVKFSAFGEDDGYSLGAPNKFEIGNPKIQLYMSGSAFKAGFDDKNLGKRITSIETTAVNEKYINNSFTFAPDNDGTGAPVFVIRRGAWTLSDIELTAASGSGVTPSIMDADLSMPIQPASDVFDFKLEYLNAALIPAKGSDSISYVYNVPFLGTDLIAMQQSHANHPSASGTSLIFTTSSISFPTNITNFHSTGSWTHSGSMHVTGTLHATELIVGVVSKSMLFASGSSKFGDDCFDNHRFTGSVSIAGNLDITDTLCEGGGNISSSYIFANSASIGEISSSRISSSIISGTYIWSPHITGSLFGTSSWAGSASQAITASYALHARSSSWAGSASQAITASYAHWARSGSWAESSSQAITASYALHARSGSWAGSASQAITASYALHARSGSWAGSASQAITASYAHWAASASHAVSSSFIQTSSYAHTSSWAMTASYVSGGLGQSDIYNIYNTHLTTSHIRNHGDYSGSYIFANSASFNSASILNLTSSRFYTTDITNTGNYSGSHIFANSASFNSASITNLTFTRASGSLYGTASWAESSSQAITASYAHWARSGSWAESSSQAITASYGRDNDWYKQGTEYSDGNNADPTLDGEIYHTGKVGVGDFSTDSLDHKLAVEGTVKLGNNLSNEHNITGSIHMHHTNLSIFSGSGRFGFGIANPDVIAFDNSSTRRLQIYDGDKTGVFLNVTNWETASAFIAGGGSPGGNQLSAHGPRAGISVNALNSSASYGYGGTRGLAGGSISYHPDTFEGNTNGNDVSDGNDRDSEGNRLLQEVLNITTGGNPQGSINIHARGDAGQQIRFLTGNDDARNSGGKNVETLRMTIKHDGEVGIGTHDPARRLHVSKSIDEGATTPIVRFETLPAAPDNSNIVMVDDNGDLYQSSKLRDVSGTTTVDNNLNVLGNLSGSHIYANSASINNVSISRTLIVGHVPDPTDTFTNHFISMSAGNISMSGWISSSNTGSFGYGKFTDIKITNDVNITRDTYIGRNVYVTNAEATVDIQGSLDVNQNTNLDNTDIDGTLVVDGSNISLDSTSTLNIDNSNTTNGIKIGTATIRVPISIGHATSETTVNDNLTVTGTLTMGTTAALTSAGLISVANQSNITGLGTISSGVWNGDAITHDYIGLDAIDGTNIGNDAINSEHYAAGSIDNEHLADDAVNSDELAAGAVDDAHLSDGVATGLAGTGTTATSGVINVIGGNGITANANDIAITAGGVDTDEIANDAVTLAKMASLARGKIIHGDASGNPAALSAGASGKLLVADANGDLSWTTVSGDASLSAGALTIAANAIEGSMLNSNTAGTGLTYAGNNLDIEAAQTVITSIKNNGLIIGGNSQNNTIDFGTDDTIIFDIDNIPKVIIGSTETYISGITSGSFASYTSGSFNSLIIGSGTLSIPSEKAFGELQVNHVTASGNISSSVFSTGSFGLVETPYGVNFTKDNHSDQGAKIFYTNANSEDKIVIQAGTRNMLEIHNPFEGTTGEVVVNEDNLDVNFRVESNGNEGMLYVDGGNNFVGIGTLAPTKTLQVAGEISSSGNITSEATITANAFVGDITGDVIGDVTGDISGNAGTATLAADATKLATPRAINEVNFDGSAAITITAAAGTLSGNTLKSTVVASSLTSVGTISTGTWRGTAIELASGGTGLVGATDGKIVIADGNGAPVLLDIGSSTSITILGTIATGVWNGDAIATDYIANDAITADKIGNDVINSEHYAAGSIDNEHLADNAVGTDEIANDAVTEDKLANTLLAEIDANTAKVTNVSTNLTATTHASQITINSSDGDNVVIAEASDTIAGLMTTTHHDKLDGIEASATADQSKSDIDGLAITTVGTIDTGVWQGTTIKTAYIEDANVTRAKIEADAIDSTKLADNAVDTEHIADDAIEEEHIGAGEVKTAALANDAVNADKLAASAVVNASVADNAAIAFAKLAALPNRNFLVGNSDGIATAVAMSGDIALGNDGATTIGATKVHGTMLHSDVAGSGLTIAGNNLDIEAAQTVITSIKNNGLILGGNSQNNTIDFGTDDKIIFDIDNVETALVHSTGLNVHGTISGSFGTFTSGSFNTLVIGSGSKPSNYGDMFVGAISMSGNITGSSSATASMGRATFTRVHTSKVVSDTTDIALDMTVGRAIYVNGSNLTAIYSAKEGNTDLVTVGTIGTGTWNGNAITTDYIANDAITEDKLANTLLAEIDANTAKVTNSDQSKSDIDSLGITTVGTIDTGVWEGTTIKTAYIGDDQITEDKLANTLLAEIDANTAKVTNSDQSKSDIDGLGITTVGTIDTGVWQGTTIKTAYIGDDQVTEDKLANTLLAEIDANTAKVTNSDQSKSDIDGLGITTVGTIDTGVWEGTTIKTAYIGDDQITEDKLANTLLAEIDANTAKVTNSDQSKSDIDGLGITTVGTIDTGVWNGTKIADAYLSDNTLHLDTAQTISAVKTIGTNVKLQFRDANTFIHSNDANDLTIGGTDVEIAATNIILDAGTLIDLQQDTDVTGDLTVSGKLVMGSTDALTDAGLISVANQSNITGLGTISSGVWQGTTIKTAYIGDDQITEDKLANTLLAEIDANTAKVTNSDQSKSDIDGLGITTVGTIDTGVWQGTTIKTAYIGDDQVTEDKLANTLLAEIDANTAKVTNSDQSKSDIDGLGITTVGTIDTGVWQGTTIKTAYIADANVTMAKLANVATNTIIGRTADNAGVPKAMSATEVRAILGVENNSTADQSKSDIDGLGITTVGTIDTGVWEGTTIKTAYIGDDQITEDKLANTLLAEIDANTAKVTNSDQSKSDIDGLGITTVGTIDTGVWQGTTIKTAYIGDDQITEDKLANTLLAEIDANTAKVTNSDQSKADINALDITELGTISSGAWRGTHIEVPHGGTGAQSFTNGGVLLGSGEGAITAMAVLTDGQMIVGDGTTNPVAESGATLRTSIGLGTSAVLDTAAISDGGAGVATADQIHTFVTDFGYTTATGDTTLAGAQTITGVKTIGTNVKLQFRDANTFIHSNDANDLLISGTDVEIAATNIILDAGTKIDLQQATDVTGDLTVSGKLVMGSTDALTDAGLLSVANQSNITGLGTISSGVWQGTTIKTAYIGDDQITEDKLANTLLAEIDANTAKVTNSDQSKADINALDITEVGTISSGVWQGTTIKTAYIGDDQITEDKLANTLLAEIDANTAKVTNSDQSKSDIDGLGITTVGTIDTGVWQGTTIKTAYIGDDQITEDKLANTLLAEIDANTAKVTNSDQSKSDIDGLGITTVGTVDTGVWQGTTIKTDYIADANITMAKLANVATNTIIGRTADNAGVPKAMSATEVRAILNVENNSTADQSKSDIDGLAITTVGTIDTGVWQGTTIKTAYIGDDQITEDKLANTLLAEIDANTAKVTNSDQSKADINALDITEVGTISSGVWQGTPLTTAYIGDNQVTVNKIEDLARGSIIIGNASAASEELTAGSAGYVLTMGDADIGWAESAAASGDITAITSILNTSLVVGRDGTDQIKFGTDNQIIFRVGNADGVTFKASGEIEATSLDISGNADIGGDLTGLDNITSTNYIIGTHTVNDIDITSQFVDADDHIMSSKAIGARFALKNANTTGNAATATQATNLNATDDRDMAPEDYAYSDDFRVFFTSKEGLEDGTSTSGNWMDAIYLNSYSDASGHDANVLAFDKSTKAIYHYQADQAATNWGTAKQLAYTDSDITGNADTATLAADATTLATPRAINEVDFDGSAAITITAAAGTLSGNTLKSTVVASSLTSVGTIATGVWNGDALTTAYIGNDQITEDKLANTLLAEIDANTAKVTNSDQSKSDIDGLGITTVGTIDTGVWQGTTIKTAYIGDDQVTEDKLANTLLAEIDANTAKVTNSDQSKSDIDGLGITTVGTIDTGVWQGTTIKTAYIGDDQVTEDKLANTLLAEIDANTAKVTNSDQSKSDIDGLGITTVGTVDTGVWQGTTIKTAYIADANITMAKLANVATNTIIGRTADNAGVPKAMSATEVRAILGVENNSTADQSKSDIDGLGITTVGTIDTGVWEGTTIKTAYIGDDQITEDKLANTLLAEIDANTAKVTNSDQSKADINALDITEVGTISSGVWQGTTIKTAYIGDDQITEDKLANTLLAEIDANTAKVTNSDQSKSDIDGLGITTVGTIDTGVWQGTTIKTAYIGDDQITEDKLANTLLAEIDANTAKVTNSDQSKSDIDGLGITTVGTVDTGVWQGTTIKTAYIADANVTMAKLANVATNTIIGRTADNAGVPKAMSATEVRAILGVENNSTADQSKSDIDGLAITTVGTIDTGVWEGTTIKTAYIGDDQITEDKLANTLLAEIDANTAKVTNSDQSKSDIDGLGITTVGTVDTGVWQGTTIKTAYIADANITMAKLANVASNTIIGRTADNAGVPKAMSATEVRAILGVENNSTADQSKSDIDGLAITTVGTIDTGVWEGTTIKTAYIGDDQITEDKLANTLLAEIDANTAKVTNSDQSKSDIDGLGITTVGTIDTGVWEGTTIKTAYIGNDQITEDKLANTLLAEIDANTAKNTNVVGNLGVLPAIGSLTVTTTNGNNVLLPAATTTNWGVMTDEMFDAIAANTAKETNEETTDASAGTKGKVALASNAEAIEGTDTAKAITPRAGTAMASAVAESKRVSDLTAPNASFNMNSQKITGLATPAADTDAASKGYVDGLKVHELTAPTSALAMNSQKITGVTDPTGAQDAATKAYVDGYRLEALSYALSDETTDIASATSVLTARIPYAFTVTNIRANVNTVSSSGLITVDINIAGSTVLSTKLTIDASEFTSATAAAAHALSDTTWADDAEIVFDIDGHGTGAKGLKITIIGYQS